MSGHRWAGLALMALAAVAPACSERSSGPGSGQLESGSIHFTVSAGLSDGIAAVRVDILQNGSIVDSRTVEANLAGSDLPLGDAYFVLAPGMYTVDVTPLDAKGGQSEVCQAATTTAVVTPSVTTEVTVSLYCPGNANGGVDVVVTTTHPPVITGLTFDPSKFTHVCEPVTLTAEASSPDNLAITYAWSIVSAPPGDTGQPAPGATAELEASGASAVFDTRTAGDYTLTVVVTDSNGHAASLSFPVHVLPGDACTPVVPRDNSGATEGRLTISGHVLDANRAPIVGAEITLSGALQAVRFSDLTGGYVFHVNPGAYALASISNCELVPSAVNLGTVTASVTQDFVAAGTGCITGRQSGMSAAGSIITLMQGDAVLGGVVTAVEPRGSAQNAAARVQQIAAAQSTAPNPITVNGHTGIERQLVLPLEPPADPDFPGAGGVARPVLGLTTAIAVGDTVVRFVAYLPASADPATVDAFFASHRNTTWDGVSALHGPPLPTLATAASAGATPPAPPSQALFPSRLATNVGELQIAASDTQSAVVYGTQFGALFRSVDNGLSVQAASTTGIAGANFGDPTVAVGAPDPTLPIPGTQAFYFAQLTTSTLTPGSNLAIQVFKSTDGGLTFASPGGGAGPVFAIDCAAAGSGCTVPDQPMMAADRHNQAVSPTTGVGADQVYLVWRVFGSPTLFGADGRTVAISCSTDGGLTWSPPDTSSISDIGDDFPRIGVAADGTVLVAFEGTGFDFPQGIRNSVSLHAFSSCASGLVPLTTAGFPVGVSPRDSHIGENCQPGLDRCPNANYMVTGDDMDPSAVFVVYARSNGSGGDDVHVAQSTNGGASFASDLVINSTPDGARFLPWICSSGGRQFVSWYDRRDASPGAPDLTAYFQASLAAGVPGGIAIPTGGDFNVSGVDDPECLAGFSGGVRNAVAETGCTNLPAGPVFGGTCQTVIVGGGSKTPCDFRAPSCPFGESCQPGGGNPNYGDYNGAACAQGKMFLAWASTTPPPGVTCAADSAGCTSGAECCSGACVSGMCTSPAGCNSTSCNCASAGTCVANGAACTSGSQCATGNCQGGACLPDISLYTTSSACSTAPCRELQVVLSAFNFHTTGSNLFDHNPNFHTPNGADSSGNVTLTCQPSGDGASTILTNAVTTETQLGCFDSYGFYATLTCAGTGTPGSLEVRGSIEFSISSACDHNDRTVTQVANVGPLPGPSSVADLNVCYAGFDLSNPPPCQRQQLAAHAAASNIMSP